MVEDDARREQLEQQAYALSDQVDAFGERLETWADDDMKLGGVFITIDQDGELNIERGLVKREDVARVRIRRRARTMARKTWRLPYRRPKKSQCTAKSCAAV
ncbi:MULTISPECIES: hypothetical protein [unclassified Paraburkholderia]|uniref:hypothetical protein n=1 Tax=unclassified Paraburkholderia TaxID=2615204 RepID=UPI000D0585A6|nr:MULTISPECIES: hypothetical protein [unclassified Paraburkholderia]